MRNHRLRDHVPLNCTACPHDYVPDPTAHRPRQCILRVQPTAAGKVNDGDDARTDTPFADDDNVLSVDGVHCGEDSGLGSTWEANLRMPALVMWPGKIEANTSTVALVSSLDLVPTLLSIVGISDEADLFDGVDISSVLFGTEPDYDSDNRVLFFWRDGFLLNTSPLGPPYGRFDVVAVKVGRIKAWYWTKSAHYNADFEEFHDPPLLFDTIADPGEAFPIDYPHDDDTGYYVQLVKHIDQLVQVHKSEINGAHLSPLTLRRDPRYVPCVDPATNCRTLPEKANTGDAVATATTTDA